MRSSGALNFLAAGSLRGSFLCLATLAVASTVHAAAPSTTEAAGAPHQLRNTDALFLGLETLGTIGVFVVYSEAAGELPKECSWCEPTGFDASVRSFLRADDPYPPAWVSHGLSLGVIPLGSFAAMLVPAMHSGNAGYGLRDGWIMLNGLLLTTAITDGTKKLSARERPAFHHGVEGATEARGQGGRPERFQSFFSGDTAWAFSATASATTLAYLRGYSTAPYIAAGGSALALTTGLLRIAADMHWATDVMAGAAVGTAVGAGLPLLLHRREPLHVQVSLSVGENTGVQLSGAF